MFFVKGYIILFAILFAIFYFIIFAKHDIIIENKLNVWRKLLMGDGKRLKDILDNKGITVQNIARATGINSSTLYTIIRKDSNIRYDFALRIAQELDIEPNEICQASPFSGELTEDEIYPTIHDSIGILDQTRVKQYTVNILYPLLLLYGKNSMPDIDKMLTEFYMLDDEARTEVIKTIEFKLEYHKDPKRAEEVKNKKRW